MNLYFKCCKQDIVTKRKKYFNVKLRRVEVFSYIDQKQYIRAWVEDSVQRLISRKTSTFSVKREEETWTTVIEISTRELPNATDITDEVKKYCRVFVK